MTKPTDPYSRVYWKVRSDERFVGIYPNDHHFATWLRLLIAAEAAWPEPADLPATARRVSLRALVDAGIILLLDSGLFRVHGLDAERLRRQERAATAASARWMLSGPVSNAGGMQQLPVSNAGGMPRVRPELSIAELSIAELSNGEAPADGPAAKPDDVLFALYGALTRTVAKKPATLDWLERLETTYGLAEAAQVLREEHARDGNPGTLLSRVNARLETAARKAESGTTERKRSERIRAEVEARRLEEYRYTGTWREECGDAPVVTSG